VQFYGRGDDPQGVDGKGPTRLNPCRTLFARGNGCPQANSAIVLRCFFLASMTSMKGKWTKGEKLALWGASMAALGVIAYWVAAPEFRHATNLEASQETKSSPVSKATVSEPGRVVGGVCG